MGKRLTSLLVIVAAMLFTLPVSAQNNPLLKSKVGARKSFAKVVYPGMATKAKMLKLRAEDKANNLIQVVENDRIAKAQVVEKMTKEILKPANEDILTLKEVVGPNAKAMNATNLRNPMMLLQVPFTGIKKAGEVIDENGIITSPEEGEHKFYTRAGTCYYVSGQSIYSGTQSGDVEIVECEDGTVYIKNIVSRYEQGSWAKGTKEGNTITIPARQPLAYSSNYDATLSLRWVMFDAEGNASAADSHAESFTFTIDGDVISLEGTAPFDGANDVFVMGVVWDDDNSFSGYADAESVWTLDETYEPPSIELVELPEGVTVEDWYTSYDGGKGNAKVAFSGDEVYVSGIFKNFPNSWIKGTIDGTTATFASIQFLGKYSNYDIFATGSDGEVLEDFIMTYDADAKQLVAKNALLANASDSRVYYLEWFDNLLIQAEAFPEDPAVTGEPVDVLPYTNDFADEAAFAEFGVIDYNEDGKTWTFADGGVYYTYNSSADGDDWLISPPIKLEAGKLYHFAIDAKAGLSSYPERFEVMMGKEAKTSALRTEVIASTDITSDAFSTFENENVSVDEDGYYHFGIHCISNADQYRLYVDNFLVELSAQATAPAAVTDFTVVPFEDGTIGATISFIAPTVNIDGSDITESLAKIDVLRDGNVIESFENVAPGTPLTFDDDDASLTIGNHKYQVIPYNAEGPGQKSEEIIVRLTGIMSVPYFVDFSASGAFETYTVIDANDDGSTWSLNNNAASYLYSSSNAADDYLVSSPIRLEAGKHYHITLSANCNGYNERMEVLLGKEPTVEGLNVTIMDPVEVSNETSEDFDSDFQVDEDGSYCFAVHAISDPDQWRLYVTTISIDVLSPTQPDVVTEFEVVPGEKGALSATVNCVAPEKNLEGGDIEGNLTIAVLRDGAVIGNVDDVLPGSPVSFVDDDISATGTYSYQAYAINANGEVGLKCAAVSVFLGPDLPMAVEDLSIQDQLGNVLFSWDEVGEVGQNGGYVNPDEVKYSIWSVEWETSWIWTYPVYVEKLGEVTGEGEVSVNLDLSEGSEQELKDFGILVENDLTGDEPVEGSVISLCFGPAYEMPFEEHVAGGSISYPTWQVKSSGEYLNAYLWEDSSDGDGSALALVSEDVEGGYVALATGKIALNNATNPVLTFDYLRPDNLADFQIVIGQPNADGTVIEQVFPVGDDWQSAKVELKDFASANYVQIMFMASFDGEGYIALDNIMVYDQLEDNLVVGLNAPKSVVAGKSVPVTITVRNMGSNVAEDYTVMLTAGDEEIEINEPVEAINPMETMTFTAEFAPSIFAEAGDVTLRAEAVYEYDLADEDNVYEAIVTVKEPSVPAPLSLSAVANGSKAELEWTVAEVGEPTELTESFEDTEAFPAWSLGGIDADNQTGAFGDWTVYDGNNMGVYGFDGINIPNMGPDYPAAWQVINSEAGNEFYSTFSSSYSAVTGEQFLWSICPVDESHAPEADHWLISPELPGIAQTISLQAKQISTIDDTAQGFYGLESFEVLASSTDSEIGSFTKVSDNQISSADWAEFTADLPEGTKFFAIRHNSTDIFGLLIDDIVYSAAGGSTATGFNIYVDEVLVGAVEGGVLTYVTNELPIGEHKVSVTALYGSNESLPVDAIVVIEVPTAIEEVINAEGLMNIFNLNGVKVQGETKHLQKGTYIINNKKVVVK